MASQAAKLQGLEHMASSFKTPGKSPSQLQMLLCLQNKKARTTISLLREYFTSFSLKALPYLKGCT